MRFFHTVLSEIKSALQPLGGKAFHMEIGDRSESVIRALSPYKIESILSAADIGDTADQCRLCMELEEKNHDISHAMQTRKNAISACEWKIECEDKSDHARKCVEKLNKELQKADINSAIYRLSGAILTGFQADEVVWSPGGTIVSFDPIPAQSLTFINGFRPQIMTSNGSYITPAHGKLLYLSMSRTHDACRGGLIRPLAWLHCFANINLKDLLSFIERYGMPFLLAKLDDATQPELKRMVRQLVQNFGTSGGGMVSRAVDIELHQPGNSGGEVYFRLLEYCEKAIIKVILGQTATAGDGGGWSNDSAQSRVRQDILDSDCAKISNAISEICALWQSYNCPEITSPMTFKIISEPPEDQVKQIEVQKQRYDAMGVAVRAGILTPTMEIEKIVRDEMGLPPINQDAQDEWQKAGGIRLPITLSQRGQEVAMQGQGSAFAMSETAQGKASSQKKEVDAIIDWLTPIQKQGEALDSISDDDFTKALADMVENPKFGSSEKFEEIATEDVFLTLEKVKK